LLLECKIFVISRQKALLTAVIEALQSLLFPFIWNYILIPILPMALQEYTETIFPFIIGLNEDTFNCCHI